MATLWLSNDSTDWEALFAEMGAKGGDTSVSLVTLVDTVDWRLWQAGYCAELVEDTERSTFSLVDREAGTVLGPARVSAMPKRPEDVSAGVVRNRLKKLLGDRSMTDLVQMRRIRRTWRVEDSVGKVFCHICVEDNGIESGAPLPGAVRVLPLRGYQRQTRGFEKQLAARLGTEPSPENVAAMALASVDRAPLDTVVRPPRLHREMTIEAALKETLRAHLSQIALRAVFVETDLDIECLHELRVAVRKSRSLISRFRKSVPELLEFADDLRWLGLETGDLRDFDVYLEEFPSYLEMVDQGSREDLEGLRAFLQAERTQGYLRTCTALQSRRFSTFVEQFSEYLESSEPARSKRAEKAVVAAAADALDKAYKRVIRAGRAISDASEDEALHDLRKDCKKLRYLLEAFSGLANKKKFKSLTRELKSLQDVLGRFQDLGVHLEALAGFGEAISSQERHNARTLLAMGELMARMKEEKDLVREQFAGKFATFDCKANKLHVRHLFDQKEPLS
jgi:CHAD domain-containing protein